MQLAGHPGSDHTVLSLARQLESLNQTRRDIEQDTLDEALALLEPVDGDRVIVIAQEGWHQGVLGIVASRILAQYFRPAMRIGFASRFPG